MAAHQETLDAPLDTTRAAVARPWLVGFATAGLTFWLAYENGSYDLSMRYALGVGVWWAVVVAFVARLARSNRAAVVTACALAAFALWTLASTVWASNAEATFSEFNRVSLYTGVFVLCSLLVRRRDLASWCDGIGFGIAAVAALSFASRAFPDTIGSKAGTTILPALENRLSYPVGYWNGLGFLCAFGIPFLLATATGARSRALRCGAAGIVPLLAAVVYMTSSRGAVAATVTGVAVFVLLTPHRWRALAAVLLTGVAAAIAVAIVERHPSFADGTGASAGVRHSVTLSVVAVVLVTAGAFAALSFVGEPEQRPPPAFGVAVAAVVAFVVVAAALAAHPVRRFEAFKEPPAALATAHGNAVTEHLLSASGSGRWQLWQAAIAEFRTNRTHGRGAGSYADWWAAHGTLALSVQDAHSLYLETLGELGVVGLALLALPFVLAAGAVATRLRRLEPVERLSVAAAAAVVCAYLVACAVDWMWELPAISIVAFAALSIVLASAQGEAPARTRHTAAWGLTIVVVVGLLAAGSQGWPLLTQLQIGASQDAARRGDAATAVDSASSAVNIQPWAASPHLQLALVEEQAGRLRAAGAAIDAAVARAPDDWHLWLVAARIQAKRGELAAARRSLRRARSLNPRSPLFARG